MNITDTINAQRAYFDTGITKDIGFRIDALNKLYNSILINESEILEALKSDLNKSAAQAYISEVGIVRGEIRHFLSNIKRWSKHKKVPTPLVHFPAKSIIVPEPYGVVLIMAPWNYPFQLCMVPLIGAIGAGNCAVIKPSAYAPATSSIVANIVDSIFPPDFVSVVEGGRKENSELLDNKFDYIFFTGSTDVGRVVMESASRTLTPVTLELGGKSPALVDETADMDLAAKRIVFGKFLNAGQTCVAPDYVLVHESVRQEFLKALETYIEKFYSPKSNYSDYSRIINKKHFDRLSGLLNQGTVYYGGDVDESTLFIQPTVMSDVTYDDDVMKDEIFGPILPVISYFDMDKAIEEIKKRPRPLALYLFSKNVNVQKKVTGSISYGGGCINDTIVHLATSNLGFGGVGDSGMGSYHGKFSFDTFTHYKSILKKSDMFDIPLRYPPYTDNILAILKKIMK